MINVLAEIVILSEPEFLMQNELLHVLQYYKVQNCLVFSSNCPEFLFTVVRFTEVDLITVILSRKYSKTEEL